MLKYTKSNYEWIQIDNKEIIKAINVVGFVVSVVNIVFFCLVMRQIDVLFAKLLDVLNK